MVRGGRWVKDAIINSEQRRTSVFFESLRKVNDSWLSDNSLIIYHQQFYTSKEQTDFFPRLRSIQYNLKYNEQINP
jgi:hypothetical protein